MRSIVDFNAIAWRPELIGWTWFNSCLNIFHGTKVLKNKVSKSIMIIINTWKYSKFLTVSLIILITLLINYTIIFSGIIKYN